MTTETAFFTLFGIAFLSMGISWILFARISMARIERKIEMDGLPRPASWDGLGARAVWYSCAITIPLGISYGQKTPFFDVMSVRKYAEPIDKSLGLAMLISAFCFVVLVFFGAFVLKLY